MGSSVLTIAAALLVSLTLQTLLLSPARSALRTDAMNLTPDPQEKAAVEAEVQACGNDAALFMKRLDLHAAGAMAAYTDALRDMNPVVRRAAAAFCMESEQETIVRTLCYANALDQMESDVARLQSLRASGGATAELFAELVKKNHFAGKILYQQCAPTGGDPSDDCFDQNAMGLREQLVDAYNEMAASFDEMSRWSVISAACNATNPANRCRETYKTRVAEAQKKVVAARLKYPKRRFYDASLGDFFAPPADAVAYAPIYEMPGLTGKFVAANPRIDAISAGRSYRSGARAPLLPGKAPKKHGLAKASAKPAAKPGPKPPLPQPAPRAGKKPGSKPVPGDKPLPAPIPTSAPAPQDPPKDPAKDPAANQPPANGSPGASKGPGQNPGDAPPGADQGEAPAPDPALGHVDDRDQVAVLNCGLEAQGGYRAETQLRWKTNRTPDEKLEFNEAYPRVMMGGAKLYACLVRESFRTNDEAVLLANASISIAAVAKLALAYNSKTCKESMDLLAWLDSSMIELKKFHDRPELVPLHGEILRLKKGGCVGLTLTLASLLMDNSAYEKKLTGDFCAWKAAVETDAPRSTFGFPRSFGKCP